MKKLLSIIATLSLLFGMTVFAAKKSIVEIAVDDDNFSILVAALQEADLVDALSGDGPFTVFAPTNAAFEALLVDLGITAEQLLSQSMLADVLLYHVVEGEVLSSALTEGMEATTLNGEKITFTLDGGAKVNGSVISAVDIEATNGVIHVIDTVIIPENFVYVDLNEDEELPDTSASSLILLGLASLVAGSGALFVTRKRKEDE